MDAMFFVFCIQLVLCGCTLCLGLPVLLLCRFLVHIEFPFVDLATSPPPSFHLCSYLCPCSAPFPSPTHSGQPIDAEELGIPEYHDVIARPMDLATLRKNLVSRRYHRLSLFVSDVRLIWRNCLDFNETNSEVCICF